MQFYPERVVGVDPAARKARAAKVMDTLQYVAKKDAVRFETTQYDSDDSSELPDPFSDDEDINTELTARRKRYSAHEVNQYLMASFSTEHKLVEAWYRETQVAGNVNPCAEDLTQICAPSKTTTVVESEECSKEIDRLLGLSGLDVYLAQQAAEKKALLAKKRKA